MPLSNFFLGIDLGTTSVKATLIDEKWRVIGQHRVEYRTCQIKPLWLEQDPAEWWNATQKVIQELFLLTKSEVKLLKAISVSSQAPTLLGVNSEGNPTGNAIIWADRRANAECKERLAPMRDAINAISGNRIDPYFMLPKLVWQMSHQPEKYSATYQYLQANGWIIYQLTGKYSIDQTHAALTQLFNIQQNVWDSSLIKEIDFDASKLPPVFSSTDIAGAVSAKAAATIGIPSGIPVLAGAIDGATAPLGLKLYQNQQAFEMSGQSSGIGLIIDKPIFQPNLCLLKHAVGNKWILKGSMSCSGGSLKWFRDKIDELIGDLSAYQHYDNLVKIVPAGSNGLIFLPYLAGERAPLWDSYVKGVFFGLHLETGKPDMVRAIMEGTAFGLRTILEEFQKIKLDPDELFGTGGGYLSAQWTQIKADILEKPFKVGINEGDTASLGSAYLALTAVTGKPISEIPEIEIAKTFSPDITERPLYRDYYRIFKKLYHLNRELFEKLTLAGGMK